ncbi:MAG: hypothetical protein HC924_03245 [Synechococcaceae cyanobacterium SM2_3_2]|nr:hypothetical protein [Synechococcaceae cyanobacterium SM2_3_2]
MVVKQGDECEYTSLVIDSRGVDNVMSYWDLLDETISSICKTVHPDERVDKVELIAHFQNAELAPLFQHEDSVNKILGNQNKLYDYIERYHRLKKEVTNLRDRYVLAKTSRDEGKHVWADGELNGLQGEIEAKTGEANNIETVLAGEGIDVENPPKGFGKATVCPIHSILMLDGLWLPKTGCRVEFRDTLLLYPKTKLSKLGESVGIPKVDGINFDQHDAGWWLENDREKFIEYAATDAIIALAARNAFDQSFIDLANNLIEMGLIDDLMFDNELVRWGEYGYPKTASSFAGVLMRLYLIMTGQWDGYKQSAKHPSKYLPTEAANKVKGGLGKCKYPEHHIAKNVDVYDAASMYPTIMKNIRYPLWEPRSYGTEQNVNINEVCGFLNNRSEGALLEVSYVLKDGLSQWAYPLVEHDSETGTSFTPREFRGLITVFELFALQHTYPRLKITVHQGIYWDKRDIKKGHKERGSVDYLDLGSLIHPLFELRQQMKDEHGKGSPQETLVKLMMNSLYGKTAQSKAIFNNELLTNSLIIGSYIDTATQKKDGKAGLTHLSLANWITGAGRAMIALMACKSDAHLCVTDSIICDHGKFVHSKDITTGWKLLDNILHNTEWKLEHNNTDLIIAKNLDYSLLKLSPQLSYKLDRGDELSDVDVNKAFEWSIVQGHTPLVKSRGDKRDPKEIFRDECNYRHKGKTVETEQQALVKAGEFLIQGNYPGRGFKPLNAQYTKTVRKSCGNNKHNVKNRDDMRFRLRLDAVSKNHIDEHGKDYANFHHLRQDNPELARTVWNRVFSQINTTKHSHRVSKEYRLAIFNAHRRGMSFNDLSLITGIPPSTLKSWWKSFTKQHPDIQTMVMALERCTTRWDPETKEAVREDKHLTHPVQYLIDHSDLLDEVKDKLGGFVDAYDGFPPHNGLTTAEWLENDLAQATARRGFVQSALKQSREAMRLYREDREGWDFQQWCESMDAQSRSVA